MDSFMGMIINFGFNFAPAGWATCQGQLLSVSQNTALFSLLGVTFGGNGQTNFGLPNLCGRVAVGQGPLPGGGTYVMGQAAGTENTTLQQSNMPMHTHTAALTGTSAQGTTSDPAGAYLANANYTDGDGNSVAVQVYSPTASGNLAPIQVGMAGGSQPFSILSPYLVVNPCIALQGIYPTRS